MERDTHTHEGQSCEITFCAQDALTGVHRVLWDLKQVACSSDQGILRRSSELILWETTQVNLEMQVKLSLKKFFLRSQGGWKVILERENNWPKGRVMKEHDCF